MPYNPETDTPVLISKKHHAMLKKLAKKNKRYIRGQLELLIEEATDEEN
jgi:hypothetical protein